MRSAPWLVLGLALLVATASAREVQVAWLELGQDSRYDQGRMRERAQGQPWGRPWQAARVALDEVRFPLDTRGVRLALERVAAADAGALAGAVKQLRQRDVGIFVADLPAGALGTVAELAGNDALVINVSARDDVLRREGCWPNLLHTAPSRALLADGLAQYLIRQKWGTTLVLRGPSEDDAALYRDYLRAAEKYGLGIAGVRPFVDSHDPRSRERNNPRLLTRGDDFDTILVADADGEFARTLPYATLAARPVVGSAGLTPDVWHWNWRRHGAPQLNNRFERAAKRPMTGHDWSAWIAIKALGEALLRTDRVAPAALNAWLRGDALVLDGFQGYPLSFREWNGQLRMPVLLAAPDWVVARAPFEGFMHARNDLDSLGIDREESRCATVAPGG